MCLNVGLMWFGSSSSHISDWEPSSFHTLECMWQEEPASAIVHFAMNVIAAPFRAAISFVPCLYNAW